MPQDKKLQGWTRQVNLLNKSVEQQELGMSEAAKVVCKMDPQAYTGTFNIKAEVDSNIRAIRRNNEGCLMWETYERTI